MRSAPHDVEVLILGPLVGRVGGRNQDLGPLKQRALLAVLALHPGQAVPMHRLIAALWPERPSANARKQIHIYVSGLRRTLGPDAIRTSTDGYLLDIDDVDLSRFDLSICRARRTRERCGPLEACGEYERAMALWRNDPLDDVPLLTSHPGVLELRRRRTAATLEYASLGLLAGECERVVHHLEALAVREPLNEAAHAQLMLALAGNGRRSDAFEVYHHLRRRLATALGVDPARQVTEAYRSILSGDPPGPAAATVAAGGHGR